MNLKAEICNAFNKHAGEYNQVAVVQKEIGTRLFERLDYLNMSPRYVLDLGCGTGYFSKQLKKRYPKAFIVGVDVAEMMLKQAAASQSFLQKWPLVQADMLSLPFPSGLFDLVFTNQVIHWSNPIRTLFQEINRVTQINGCLMFSTLGPDTFLELRRAWAHVHSFAHTNTFTDMHDLGDVLLAEHFVDPVVDMEKLAVHYPSLSKLLRSLQAQGVRNVNPARNPGLTGKAAYRAFEACMNQFCTEDDQFPLSYEVIYGHAWKGTLQRGVNGTEAFIPISQLTRKMNKT